MTMPLRFHICYDAAARQGAQRVRDIEAILVIASPLARRLGSTKPYIDFPVRAGRRRSMLYWLAPAHANTGEAGSRIGFSL